jgi:predicted amidohydrolase
VFPLKVAAIQVNSRNDKDHNIARAATLIDRAASAGAQLAVLPEYVDYLGPADPTVAESVPGPTSDKFSAKAREHSMWILVGSLHERVPHYDRWYNTSLLIDQTGNIVAKYRKIHLFDVDLPGRVQNKESELVTPGRDIVTSICYDLRFPELYRQLAVAGAQVLTVPSAFMLYTGRDHWEVLLRARAIENQCYVVAAAQFGRHEPDGLCQGRSMIIDPWGTVIACAPDSEGIIVADLDTDLQDRVRSELPALANRRPEIYAIDPLRHEA